jgi:RNA polymerase sigma factor (sigma-70 family)
MPRARSRSAWTVVRGARAGTPRRAGGVQWSDCGAMVSRLDYGEVFEAHVWEVHGFFAYRLGSRAEAEDLTQATFERGLRAWGRFDPRRASVRTWLLAIAHNLLVDHYRSRARRREIAVPEGLDAPAADERHRLGLDPALARALDELGEREREVIALRFGGDLTGPEIAMVTGLSLANVQQILSRALRRLRASLEAQEDPAHERPGASSG